MYSLQTSASGLADAVLSDELTAASLVALYGAGLLTSLSPCSLGLLPLTVGYISQAAGERRDRAALVPTLAFAGGLAAVFCGLGWSAASLGGVLGSDANDAAGGGLVLASAVVAVASGLQLLEVVDLPLIPDATSLPKGLLTTNSDTSDGDGSTPLYYEEGAAVVAAHDEEGEEGDSSSAFAALFRTFLLGGSSALLASPCATPVLTSILAFVGASGDPTLGSALLATYTLGYSTPLLVAGATGGGFLARARDLGGGVGQLVNPLTGSVLVCYGTNSLLVGLLGDPSLSGLSPVL